MQVFTRSHKMADIVLTNCDLLPVIQRFGIHLGFGDKTVEAVCMEYHLDPNFFLAVVNTFLLGEHFPDTDLLPFSPLLIVDYLRKTHGYYLNEVLPRIGLLLRTMREHSQPPGYELELIENFYAACQKELIQHIQEEEQQVFPYITALLEGFSVSDSKFTMRLFEHEHTNAEQKLNDLKALVIKYISPSGYPQSVCNEFLCSLFHFESDIRNHARIEDRILIPQLIALEKKMKA